ncbi:hypothetical protein [Agarilytica rhodophyticola]|nr:hypothetical protein [Agarilytica rhodophyticola]
MRREYIACAPIQGLYRWQINTFRFGGAIGLWPISTALLSGIDAL